MKNSQIKKEQKQNRSKKAPAVEHENKEHLSHLIEEEAHKKPVGGRFGKTWFPYNKK